MVGQRERTILSRAIKRKGVLFNLSLSMHQQLALFPLDKLINLVMTLFCKFSSPHFSIFSTISLFLLHSRFFFPRGCMQMRNSKKLSEKISRLLENLFRSFQPSVNWSMDVRLLFFMNDERKIRKKKMKIHFLAISKLRVLRDAFQRSIRASVYVITVTKSRSNSESKKGEREDEFKLIYTPL